MGYDLDAFDGYAVAGDVAYAPGPLYLGNIWIIDVSVPAAARVVGTVTTEPSAKIRVFGDATYILAHPRTPVSVPWDQ